MKKLLVPATAILLGTASFALISSDAARADITISEEPNPAFEALVREFDSAFVQFETNEAMTVDQEVINGIPVDRRFFPAVLGKMRAWDPAPTCTASLIGPTTVLIAAHCVDDNPEIRLESSAGSVIGLCIIAPGWNSEADNGSDLALCTLNRAVMGITYERVSFNLPQVGQTVYLTGFGCTEEDGGRDGVLRLGSAPAQNRPEGFAVSTGTLYTVASIDDGQAVLCPGDSGGPLYVMRGTIDGPRSIIAVNSATTFERGVSLFAALGAPANAAFVQSFANGEFTKDMQGQLVPQEVCGLNLDLGCKVEP